MRAGPRPRRAAWRRRRWPGAAGDGARRVLDWLGWGPSVLTDEGRRPCALGRLGAVGALRPLAYRLARQRGRRSHQLLVGGGLALDGVRPRQLALRVDGAAH